MSRLPLTLRPSRPADVPARAEERAPLHRLGKPARVGLTAAGWLAAAAALFTTYLHLSRTVAANSDGASIALQAWSMLHGNLLLHGWILADVSFYTTELPQYMLIEHVNGLNPDDMHIAGAMTYTILVLLAAWVAKGGARGAEGWTRAGLAAVIMIAPPVGSVYVLMLEPDHVGSVVPVLLLVAVLDRVGTAPWAARWNPRSWRWCVPLAAFLLVVWALIADPVILFTMVGPLIFVAVVRGYRRLVVLRREAWTAWFEAALAASAVLGAFTADRIVALIRASGGYQVFPVNQQLAWFDTLPRNLQVTVQGVLVLFGANFAGHRVGVLAAIGLLHLLGIGLVIWAVCVAFRHLWRRKLSVQLLAVSVSFTLVVYLLGPNALSAQSSREMAAVLPLGAALAGRVLARRLRRVRLGPALAAALAVYLGGLAYYATRPPVPASNQALGDWLASHRLYYGLTTGYWTANSTTVDTSGRVALRYVQTSGNSVAPSPWEINLGWYSPRTHVAGFLVLPQAGPGSWRQQPGAGAVVHSFGKPAHAYELPSYTVLVWNQNVLSQLADVAPAGPGS
jgi:hypothetical protein